MKEYSLKSEAELIQQLQRNDEQALAALMRLYYNDLYNYGARFTDDTALIKDCIQEIFISLWQRRETADTILSPRYYFLRATKNKILKALYKHLQPASLSSLQPDYH
jgi:RNA polymerase sigma factor (sigma-70 family)